MEKASQFLAGFELAGRYSGKEAVRITFPSDVLPFVMEIRDKNQEYFVCISLNGANEVIGNRVVTVGLLNANQIGRAWHNAKRLSREVGTLILDHHLMRSYAGVEWLERLSSETGNKVICGADFMKQPRMLLEARRKSVYTDMPVPAGWHKSYAEGKVGTDHYWNLAKRIYKSMRLDDYR